jgi:AmmeMemoRadiSam system protein A
MPPLCSDDRRVLLVLARRVITQIILNQQIPDVPVHQGRLAEPCGAFVTLRSRGRLRGCVGSAERNLPLSETVAQAAVGVLRDPRFRPPTAAELPEIEIEMSLLSEIVPVSLGAIEAIEIGRHGLIVAGDGRRGLLLPQVAARWGWTAERFVEETCRKAGLDATAWRRPGMQLFAFTAETFSERDFSDLNPPVQKNSPPRGEAGSKDTES